MDNQAPAKPHCRLMRRRDLAMHLRAKYGMRCSEQTLAKYASNGGGPAFRRAGRDVVYEVEVAEAWAEARISGPMLSTSDLAGPAGSSNGSPSAAHIGKAA